MKSPGELGLIFIIISFIGFYLAYLYGRKTKRFKWSEYIAILIAPMLSILLFAYFINARIIILFLISSFAGSILEYGVGLTYEKTLNKKLWIYQQFSIDGYTSLLSIPIWGIAGVIFWFLGELIGM